MAAARYTIHLPGADELGQPLRLHEAVYQRFKDLGGQPTTIHRGEPHHIVTTWAEDTPEWDSQAKQLGTLAGELANVPSVHVTKEGDKPAAWEMANNSYQPGEGAEDVALAHTSIHSKLTGNPTPLDDILEEFGPLHP
jgi:hypothetical protein